MKIAIGALGGSGTRAVAEILIQSGIYIGNDLNRAYDTLLFSRLFNNPNWHRNSTHKQREERLELYSQIMRKQKIPLKDLKRVFSATKSNSTYKSYSGFYAKSVLSALKPTKSISTWGWKEPNTQIYLKDLLELFDDLKYIHVLRHGLDMAFSSNKHQLKNWGWKFGLAISDAQTDDDLARMQLDYWIESTKAVLMEFKHNPNRITLINHTAFCNQPKSQINKILEFCNIQLSQSQKDILYKIPKNTGSNNRFKSKDLTIFRQDQLDFVKEMGFEI